MSLPSGRPHESVKFELSSGVVEYRALNLYEIRALQKMDADESDAQAIAWAADVTVDEAADWIKSATAGDTAALLAAIMRTSGLDPEESARFQT